MPQPVCVPPGAAYSASPVSGYAPLYVEFTDESVGSSPMTYEYAMGDGAVQLMRNPTYTYYTPGTYDTSLTVKNACGEDSDSGRVVITVLERPGQCMASNYSVCMQPTDTNIFINVVGPNCDGWTPQVAVPPRYGAADAMGDGYSIQYRHLGTYPDWSPLPDTFKYWLVDPDGNRSNAGTITVSECGIS
jgi:PKD repeat protein